MNSLSSNKVYPLFQPNYPLTLLSGAASLPAPTPCSAVQPLGVKTHVVLDEGRHEVVAVIIALLKSAVQRSAACCEMYYKIE